MKKPATTKLRCPKCGSRNLYLTEVGTWTSQFLVTDGNFDREQGEHEPESVDRLEARCRAVPCLHLWKVRGASQIDDAVALTSTDGK